ncbi:MAG: hypothetical protein ACREQP_16725 [Candidatus Binatia bacterium]
MKARNHGTRIDTTLGELIAAASEVAFEHSQNAEEAYKLTSLVLVEMLKKRFAPAEIDFEGCEERTPGKNYLQ